MTVKTFPRVTDVKLERLHGVARAALDGQLDVTRLKELGPQQAMTEVQRISGIGPFYSGLIIVRGTGFADVLPANEPIALELIRQLYRLSAPPSPQELETVAEPWRPFRTWAIVLIRAATKRLVPARDNGAQPKTCTGSGPDRPTLSTCLLSG